MEGLFEAGRVDAEDLTLKRDGRRRRYQDMGGGGPLWRMEGSQRKWRQQVDHNLTTYVCSCGKPK